MARKKPRTKEGKRRKTEKVMHEFKHGTLHSSSGQKVTNPAMAKAIAMSESGIEKKRGLRKAMGQKIKYTHHK